jgi:perosamine synthetase
MVVNWNSPKFGGRELELVKQVLNTGYVSEGPMTKKLEKQLGKICNTKHIIMTTSATAALYLAIEADKRIRNYTEGEVIIPNLTFIATKNAVEMAGLIPKIEDVWADNRFMCKGESYMPEHKIQIPVNLLGRNWDSWNKFGNLSYIDTITICDNAGCLGSNVPNGKVGCYSLQANKLITCGQGGFCATDDDEYAKVIREIKDFGRKDKYDQHTQGFNFKFNDIQAAIVLGQLEQLEDRARLHISQYYNYKLDLSYFGKFVDYTNEEVPLWVEFITDKRDELFEYLKENGVEARKPWKPLVDNPELYPNTDYYTKNCLWLPNGASLSSEDQTKVISLIKKFYEDRK